MQIHSATLRQQQRLAHRQTIAHHQHLIDEFHRLACAVVANMGDRLAHCLKDRQRTCELVCCATNHDAQRAARCALAAPADRCIQHLDALKREPFGNRACGLWADGAAIDHQRTRSCAMDHAVFTQNHCLDIGRIAHAGDDDVTGGGHVGRAGAKLGARCNQLVAAAGCAIPHHQRKAGIENVARHTAAHDTQTDKSNSFAH